MAAGLSRDRTPLQVRNSSNTSKSPSASQSQSASATNVKRYRPYSSRYKRKRIQKALSTQCNPQSTNLTEPLSRKSSASDENLSDTDDFYSCYDFNDFDEASRCDTDLPPNSTDSEDVGSDDDDLLIRNILLRDYEDLGGGKIFLIPAATKFWITSVLLLGSYSLFG